MGLRSSSARISMHAVRRPSRSPAMGPSISVVADNNPLFAVFPAAVGAVLHFSAPNAQAISLNQISNAFSGDSSAVVGGEACTRSPFQDFNRQPSISGSTPSQATFPTELGGVEVTFDGVPAASPSDQPRPDNRRAAVELAGSSQCTQPTPTRSNLAARAIFTSVQVSYNGAVSNSVWMPVSSQLPGLLPNNFPMLPFYRLSTFPDGNVRNQDGSQNDAEHPAASWFHHYGLRHRDGRLSAFAYSRFDRDFENTRYRAPHLFALGLFQ